MRMDRFLQCEGLEPTSMCLLRGLSQSIRDRPLRQNMIMHLAGLPSHQRRGGSEHCPQSLRTLSKNEAWLSAEDELVWARERFRADCAARAIRTCEDAEWHYTRIRDARAAVVRAECIWMYIECRTLTSCSATGSAGGPR